MLVSKPVLLELNSTLQIPQIQKPIGYTFRINSALPCKIDFQVSIL